MNIFKWLKNKTGKLPISLAQAAGITAVVGAAGFGAMSFLSSPADNNNTFLPPTTNQGQVVYVSQNGGGGQYEANGEVGSSFKAAPSRAIQLANQEAARQAQTRALEESAGQQTYQQPGDEVNPQLPKAYQLSNTDLGLGMGTGADKQLNSSLEAFSTIQNQLAGVTQAVNNVQAQAQGGQGNKRGTAPQGSTSGQTAAQLASATRNWGSSGLTRAGGGSGSSNAFVLQNSGKNTREKESAAAVAQAGGAIAQAQAAMAQMQEGTRMQSRAHFGSSEGLGQDKDAALQRSRRFTGKGKDELTFIRKQTAAINANKTNAANEGGNPFLASAKISGGLTVNGDNVTTGQSSSGDLRSMTGTQMKGINSKLGQVQANMDEREAARDDLKNWMWQLFTTGLIAISAIAVLVLAAKAGNFIWGPILYALAGILTAATLAYIWAGAIKHITSYNGICGSDGWTTFGWALSGILTAGVGLAWTTLPGKLIGDKIPKLITAGLAVVGLGSVGLGLADILKKGENVESLEEKEKYQQGDEK